MAATVTSNLTLLFNANNTGTFNTGSFDANFPKEGSHCRAVAVGTSVVQMYATISSTNLSNTHIYMWLMVSTWGLLDTYANGGLRIYVGDGTNWGEWYVGGKNTYVGGWECFVVDTNTTNNPFNRNSGTPNMSAITQVGAAFLMATVTHPSVNNSYMDAARYGNNGLTITGGSSGDPATLEDIYLDDDGSANAYGVVSKRGGVYFFQGPLTFGTSSGSILFRESNNTGVFLNRPVASTLYKIDVTGGSGTSEFQLGTVTGSGSSAIGASGVTITSAGPDWDFTAANTGIDTLKLYGSTITNADDVHLGSTSNVLGASGSTIDLVDTTFSSPTRVVRNISSSATTNLLRNQITFASDPTASLDVYDAADTDSGQWQVIGTSTDGGPGFIATATGTQTLEVSDHNFVQMDKPYLTVAANETWDVVNPTWTVTDQTEIDFTSSTSNIVNEKFSLDLTVQNPSGTKLQNAYTYLYEGLVNQNLPTANRQATDSNGLASSEILKKTYTDGGGTALTTTTYGDFALKVYYYGRSPFVGAITVSAAIDQSITLITDTAIAEATQATAITNGSGITVQHPSNPCTLLSYDNGTTAFQVDDVVVGVSSGAQGTVVQVVEGDTASGRLFLDTRNATATFTAGENLQVSSVTYATATNPLEQLQYSWHVDAAGTKTLQTTYDYLAAKMAAASPDAIFLDAIIWGEAEQSQLFYSSASGYFTERNVNLTEGVFVTNSAGGTIAYYTADDGTTYTPPSTITLTVNGVVQNTQCYIAPTAGGAALLNAEATTNTTGNQYAAATSYTWTTNVPVTVRAREMGYLPYESSGTITNADFTVTAVWLLDPNWKLVIKGVNITFNENAPSDDTIVRASGSFVTDGWLAVMSQVTVSGSTNNDGTYEIQTVAATTLTLATTEDLVQEGPVSGVTLTFTRREPDW